LGKHIRVRRSGQGSRAFVLLLAALFCVLAAGCSAKHYRRSADKEVYRIVQQAERRIFGRTNAFSIDTRVSGREPASVLPREIIEERSATNRRVINLEEALKLAVANSREYQTQKEQLYLAALSLTGARYAFTPQFFANSQAKFSGTADKGIESDSLSSGLGVDQLFKTGGALTVSLANELLHYYSGTRPDEHSSLLSVVFSQPLLRGFGRNSAAVESLTQAERNVIYAVRSYNLYQRQFAVNVVKDYFALLGRKDAVRNNYTNYTRRVDTTKYLEARAVDRVRKSEVDDARTSELGAKISYIDSVASYQTQLDAFKLRLGLPLSETLYLDDADLRELAQAGLIKVDVDRNAAFALALAKHMDALNAIDRFEDAQRKVRVAADQLRADLKLFGNASWRSEPVTDYTSFDPSKISYGAGLSLDLPIDRLRERNDYRATLVSFESQLRSLSLTLDNFRDKIDRGLRTLEQGRLNYLNRRASLEVAQRRVEMNLMLLEAGRVQIRDLREAQDSLILAQNNLTSSVVDYLQARLQLLLDIGVLDTTTEEFWLKDPLQGRLTDAQRGPPPLQMPRDEVVSPNQFLEPAL
jgi:outer membrane protein TolC